jgi:ferredoxin/flavodoxin---NADP+ reductase
MGESLVKKILAKEQLSEEVYRMKFEAPLIARERKPGQFIILQLDTEFGERIPLTIADADPVEGSVTIIFQTVGRTTHILAEMEPGDHIENVLGPLGHPTHIENFGTAVCIGGGIGVAPMHPIAQALKAAGNKVIIIMGARNRELLVMEEEMKKIADELIICTDDGSYGRKDLVTVPLKELCERDPKPDIAVAIGPPIMMKFCAETTRPYGVHTMVSLNTIMVDGTGMCGGCRVTVGGETKFVCVDGPEFDGHKVDFDNMMLRLGSYKGQEQNDHEACHLELEIQKKEKEQS